TRFGAGLVCATFSRAAATALFLSTRYSRSPLILLLFRSRFFVFGADPGFHVCAVMALHSGSSVLIVLHWTRSLDRLEIRWVECGRRARLAITRRATPGRLHGLPRCWLGQQREQAPAESGRGQSCRSGSTRHPPSVGDQGQCARHGSSAAAGSR